MKKIRVFEAFAGIGAQSSALKRLENKYPYEIVGISEWFIDALNCYQALHGEGMEIPDEDVVLTTLTKHTFSKDSVKPIGNIEKLSKKDREELYISHTQSKNYGSITEIDPKIMPTSDLFIYSFPCQDLSTGGKTLGMGKGSGTRSGLLWEVERILRGLHKENRLPKYLLLENVKTLFAPSNKNDLDQWLNFLVSIGYCNSNNMILDARDFGIPQARKRAFIISKLGSSFDTSPLEKRDPQQRKFQISDFLRTDYLNPVLREEANKAQLNNTTSRQDMWKINKREQINNNLIINTITCNMDRSNTAAMFEYTGPKGNTYRLLTIREAFLLMGFTEIEYGRTMRLDLSYRKMNKLIGNSIVVNVLTDILELICKDFFEK